MFIKLFINIFRLRECEKELVKLKAHPKVQDGKGDNPVQDLAHEVLLRENGPSDQVTLPPITSPVIESPPFLKKEESAVEKKIPKLAEKDEQSGDWWVLV